MRTAKNDPTHPGNLSLFFNEDMAADLGVSKNMHGDVRRNVEKFFTGYCISIGQAGAKRLLYLFFGTI